MIRCYVIIPFNMALINAIKAASKEAGVELVLSHETTLRQVPIAELVYSEIARCDLIIADVSRPNPNVFYGIGLAHSMGKYVVFLIDKEVKEISFNLQGSLSLSYAIAPTELAKLRYQLSRFLGDFIRSPQMFHPFLPFPGRSVSSPYIVDLEKLDPREFENLCFELITQMGFRKVEWGKEFREIDVVATLPKKDPDGYEYQELWFILMGRHAPVEMMLEIAVMDAEHFFNRVLRYPEGIEELLSKYKIRYDAPMTILFISRREGPRLDFFEYELRRKERRLRERRSPFTIRVRLWDSTYLTNLIHQYPQIAFKYFSEESRIRSKYRKTPEELYQENVKLTEEILLVKNQLEEEKKKRFIAERNAAWKDVAFKAAHKLGNPIDAIDTYLQGLKRRIQNKRIDEALQKANDMESSIEEAKAVIAQFKSLTKSQEISPRPVELLPLIQQACKTAEEKGVNVSIQIIENCP